MQQRMQKKGFNIDDCVVHQLYFSKYETCTPDYWKKFDPEYKYYSGVGFTKIKHGNDKQVRKGKHISLKWGKSTIFTTLDLDNKKLEYSVSNDEEQEVVEIIDCDSLMANMIYIFTFAVDGCDCKDKDLVNKGMTYQLNITHT